MNIIVTGSAGFLGRNLAKRLLREGYNVYGLDIDKTKDRFLSRHKNFIEKKVDLRSFGSVQKACGSIRKIEYVFHTAAIQPVDKNMDISEYINTNLVGAANLLKACGQRDFKNFIVSSSFSVYGKPEYLPMDERHPARPINIYGLTKLQAELLFEFYARRIGFNTIILRYDGIYGNGQTLPGFIQYLLKSFREDEDVLLFNNGRQKRDNVYIDDVVKANIKAMKLQQSNNYVVFNIGGGEVKTSFETAMILKEALRSRAKIVLSGKKNPHMDYDIFMDIKKARRVLSYSPKGFRENIITMIKEAREDA